MIEQAEDRGLAAAEWIAEATTIYRDDLDNYKLLADNLGCTVLEAMLLNALGFVRATDKRLHYLASYVADFHMREFPEKWEKQTE